MHSTRQDAALPEEIAQTIVAKAEGNPFFLEELTRAVVEHGDIHTDLMVPDTIQGVQHLATCRQEALGWLRFVGRIAIGIEAAGISF